VIDAAVVDCGGGNLASVIRALEACSARVRLVAHPDELGRPSHIVLPGQGAFADGMRTLRESGLVEALGEQVAGSGTPLLGICLGLQLLGLRGNEGGPTAGLGRIEGEVVKLEPDARERRLPHVGWNQVELSEPGRDHPLFRDIPDGTDFYFLHSYHLRCRNPGEVLAHTPYCGRWVSAAARGNIQGVQFHPEKSQAMGLKLLRNFLSL
jgi:imidazole glycerol-phosphate synthase subunit HisH